MKYIDLGLKDYKEVWDFQEEVFSQNLKAKENGEPTQNTLIFCEHPHTITLGKNGKNENLLFQPEFLKNKGVDLYHINRGGDVTYHGPGQLVVYPIFDLESFGIGLRQYICNLEQIMIQFLSLYGVKAERSEGATGVWIDTEYPHKMRKIGAIGVRCSRYITMHGLALNINSDLSFFSLINPCGFIDKGVTSLEKETGNKVNMETVKIQFKQLFDDIFVPK